MMQQYCIIVTTRCFYFVHDAVFIHYCMYVSIYVNVGLLMFEPTGVYYFRLLSITIIIVCFVFTIFMYFDYF